MTMLHSPFGWRSWIISAAMVCLLVVAGTFSGVAFALRAEDDAKLLKDAQGAFQPLPKDAATKEHPLTAERVSLGRKLFFDPRISVDGTGSCVHCHQPSLYGADGLPRSRGVRDQEAPRNAP